MRAVKLFADGAVGSRGAALLEPYSDAPGQRGSRYLSDDEMRAKIVTALPAGFQVNVHAIGDAANRQVLDAFEAAYAAWTAARCATGSSTPRSSRPRTSRASCSSA